MAETIDYNRPLANPVADTPIVFTLLAAEKPNSPAAMTAGSTAELDLRVQADADPSGGFDIQDLFKVEVKPLLDIAGLTTCQVTVTPIHGDGSLGTPIVTIVTHEQNMDTWQTQAGQPRP